MNSNTTSRPTTVEVRRRVFEKNDALAGALRRRFQDAGTLAVNLLSSPGSGKTTLLEHTLSSLSADLRVGALVGDLATENDANRLARSGAPVWQISTGTNCHLEAQMVGAALDAWDPGPLDVLFIENVGNLVCPADYDLGEELRVVLLATTEGEDKPLKYPPIFHSADVALITKMDLAAAVEFDRAAAHAAIETVHPGMRVMQLSARTGEGMAAWLDLLRGRRELAANEHRQALL